MDDVLTRYFDNLAGRIHGPMHLRLVLQPLMAVFFAIRDGRKDAREGRPPYLLKMMTDRIHSRELLRSGWESVGKVFIVALALDAIYQFIFIHWFYPLEAVTVALFLAIVPYVLLRGPANRFFSGADRTKHDRRRYSH
jgi:hypothetical protein